MKRLRSKNLIGYVCGLLWILVLTGFVPAQKAALSAEQRIASEFERLRDSPPKMLEFISRMPKGGDLHNHLSGAIYAESYIRWAAEKDLCVRMATMVLSSRPCLTESIGEWAPATKALIDPVLHRQLVDAWSMRNWHLSGQSGHDHFFDTFGKFGLAGRGQLGTMMAEAASRASHDRLSYIELMLTPDAGAVSEVGEAAGWNGNFAETLKQLNEKELMKAVALGLSNLRTAEIDKDTILRCGTAQADPGCGVTVRYISQIGRSAPLAQVFAQMAAAFIWASDPESKVVALNLVQAEDSPTSMQHYSKQMQMLKYLRGLYPKARVSLHAGELAAGLVPPEGLRSHIYEAVVDGGAMRIGHGVDIMNEDEPYRLMKIMADRKILVEICLTSNETILGVTGARHPMRIYMEKNVPVALGTDDAGVSRSDMSHEFLKAATDQGLGYSDLKRMARNSLEYAFAPGGSLWADLTTTKLVEECQKETLGKPAVSGRCTQYLEKNEKAKLQFSLEQDIRSFEGQP